MIRAKMHCDEVSDQHWGTPSKVAEYVRLTAVYGKDGSSNAQWSAATPSGQITLTITNPDAWGKFKRGAFYFIDMSETTEEA